MPKHNTKGKCPPQKKVKIIKKNKKQTYTLEHKNYARELKKQGKQPHEIKKLFMEKYEVEVRPSTLATWYNKSNMERHEQRGHTNTSMASVETHVNPSQRPTILIDMEFALVQQVEKSNNSGTVTTKKTLKKMGQCLFNKLRALKIYDDSGERLQPLSELTEARIHTLLKDASKATIECPICHAPVRSDSEDGLLDHIRAYHVPDAELPPPRGNEKVYIFTASNGWARNFLKRHNIHSVRTQGEMGSNKEVDAKEFVDKLRNELIDRGIAPKIIVRILLNIDETGIVYKSVPKRTYKIIGTPFMARKPLKDRVTVLVGASMDGFKLKPVVIGRAQNPRALRDVDWDEIPVHYYGQPSSWMSQKIMEHWFYHHLDPELKAHYGENVEVILTIDNAGCHPPNLNNLLDYVEVRYLPANTTALIQPMDQGVIHVFKLNYLDIYYNKMIEYVLQHDDDEDPMKNFPSTYTMKDVVIDVGQAWGKVKEEHIHKCFEKLICPDDYVKQWNETHNDDVQWSGVNFRGFENQANDNSATERADRLKKINELVLGLQAKIDTLPEQQQFIIDVESVEEAIHYDPNADLDNTEELITLGFLSQREEEGLSSEDNDRDIPQMAHEALKSLANIGYHFRPDDFKSKEAAEQASTHLEALQKIFMEQKKPITSTIPTQPGPPSPQASTSDAIRHSPVRPVPSENESNESLESLGAIGIIDFDLEALDYEVESAADSDDEGNATVFFYIYLYKTLQTTIKRYKRFKT